MARRSCDGSGLLEAFRAAVANLEAHVDEINGLNVYPVPDGDTGSNMAATVRAALDEAEAVAGQPVERVAAAISFGALMGARGNSGVILSQLFRGLGEAVSDVEEIGGRELAHALKQGCVAAFAAVSQPVEGTILTVVRDASTAAAEALVANGTLEHVLAAAATEATASVARTPSMLPILRNAGVVDAGGKGLELLLRRALALGLGDADLMPTAAMPERLSIANSLLPPSAVWPGASSMVAVTTRPPRPVRPRFGFTLVTPLSNG